MKQLQDGMVKWKNCLSAFCRELLLGINGVAIEFEWNIFPRFTPPQTLQEIPNDLQKRNIEPEKFTDRIIFISMLNDIDWTSKGNDEICISNSEKSRLSRRSSRRDTGRSSVLEAKRSDVENQSTLVEEGGIP